MEEQLRQTLEELATEKTTNKAKDNYDYSLGTDATSIYGNKTQYQSYNEF
jgi:hypothetical protein